MVSHARSTALSVRRDKHYSEQDSPRLPAIVTLIGTCVTISFISTYHSASPPHALSHRSHMELSSPLFFHGSKHSTHSMWQPHS
jgi:hypothetical protein